MEIITTLIRDSIDKVHTTVNDFSELLHHLSLVVPKRKLDSYINEHCTGIIVVNLRMFIRVPDTHPPIWIKAAQVTPEGLLGYYDILGELTDEENEQLRKFIDSNDLSIQ